MKFVNSRGGSWSDFPARFRGGVVDEVRKFEGGWLERFFFLFFFLGAPLDTWGPLWIPGGPKLQLT